jgi:two-component system, sensor histidine kinase and response regulator
MACWEVSAYCSIPELLPSSENGSTPFKAAAEALLQLVNDILDLSKIEVGKLRLERVPFHVKEVANGALAVVLPMAKARGLLVRQEVDGDLSATLLGDPQRLMQILLNLLSNAVKFTERGSITIGVAFRGRAERDIEVQFTVKDIGIGIPADVRGAIFEPFTQADSSTTRRYGGTGLGLTICRELVALMTGRLDLESAPGEGSTFRVTVAFETTDAAPLYRGCAGSHSAIEPQFTDPSCRR